MHKNQNGFTLVELMMVVGILTYVILALVQLFIYTSTSAQLGGNKTLALSEVQNKIEEIRNYEFDDVATDYASSGTPGNKFDLIKLTGKGVITLDSSVANLLTIEIVACWQDKYGRIIGEDTDLDGVLDTGEDANGNNKIDSPVTLITMRSKR